MLSLVLCAASLANIDFIYTCIINLKTARERFQSGVAINKDPKCQVYLSVLYALRTRMQKRRVTHPFMQLTAIQQPKYPYV